MRVITSRLERRDSAKWGAMAAAGLVAILAVLGLVAADIEAGQAPQQGVVPRLFPSDSPLAGGSLTSLDAATREFAVPFSRPDTQLASDSTIAGVWIRGGDDPQVYIQYESGIAVTVRLASAGLPTEDYAAAQTKDGVPGVLVEIGGVAAFEVPQSDEGDLGSVRMVLDGAIVTLIGHGDFPPSVLREVAASVVANSDDVKASSG